MQVGAVNRGTDVAEEQVEAGNVAPIAPDSGNTPAEKGRKKREVKTTAAKKAKKAKKTTVELNDDEDGEATTAAQKWTDPEVIQLISFRNEMDGDFKCNAKKQGINMWEKIQGKMIAACDNFSKSSEACRKKWKVVYRQYCTDKRL